EPFYTDTIKYIIFCTGVAEAMKQGHFGTVDIVHLHDWHSSMLLFLKKYHPSYSDLKKSRFVFCIHNLAIQGIRPFENSYSSLKNWFPKIKLDHEALRDPRYPECFNLMAIESDLLMQFTPFLLLIKRMYCFPAFRRSLLEAKVWKWI